MGLWGVTHEIAMPLQDLTGEGEKIHSRLVRPRSSCSAPAANAELLELHAWPAAARGLRAPPLGPLAVPIETGLHS